MAKKSMVIKQQRKQKYSTREYNRCKICGRPHAYLRKFGICRICFRELAYKGQIPGYPRPGELEILIEETEDRWLHGKLVRIAKPASRFR